MSDRVLVGDHIEVRAFRFDLGKGQYTRVVVNAGVPVTEHVVPPAGEAHAFDRLNWPLYVEVSVSPTGRSARVFINGKEVRQ